MLRCECCGRSGELGTGWVTFVELEADDGAPWSGEYCPSCANEQFGDLTEGPRTLVRVRQLIAPESTAAED
jgi:hypothetical protein